MRFFIYLTLNGIVIAVLLLVPIEDLVLPQAQLSDFTVDSYKAYMKLRNLYIRTSEIIVIVMSFIPALIYFFWGRYDFTINKKS